MQYTMYLVNKNSKEHGWSLEDHPPEMDEEKPEYSRFWYVGGLCKDTSWEQIQNKKLQGDASLKNMAQLQNACRFMECLGFPEEAKASSAQIENVKYTLLIKELEHCRSI